MSLSLFLSWGLRGSTNTHAMGTPIRAMLALLSAMLASRALYADEDVGME